MLRAWHVHRALPGGTRLWECTSTTRKPEITLKLPNNRCQCSETAGSSSHAVRHACHTDLQAMHLVSEDGNIGWSFGQLQAEFDLKFSTILVSASDTQVDGFICGWHVSEELQILALAVSQEKRCQGIGRALLEELLRIGKGLGDTSACLELREGNKPAVRLYSRAGFREVGRRRQYYDNGDAAILMSKQLYS